MVIKKMNSVFHKHSRWLFGAFTVIIIVSFLGFLTPGSGSVGGCGLSKDQIAGVAYGKEITYDDLFKVMRSFAALNRNADEKTAFEAICLQAKAEQLGIGVADAELTGYLQKQFQTDGKYDPARYREFIGVMRQHGFNEEEVFDGFRMMLLNEKLFEFISNVPITDSEVQKAYRELNTRFTGKAYTFKAQESGEAIPTVEVEKFFKEHAANYVIDGSLTGLVIEFPYADYTAAAQKTEKEPAKVAEAAKVLAKDAAEKFANDVYDALKALPAQEQSAAFKKMAADRKLAVKEHRFSFNSGNAGDLKQTDFALLQASEPVAISSPVAEEKAVAVGFVTSRVDPRQAKFEEVTKEVYKDCKAMRTLVATEAKVRESVKAYNACKDDAARAALLKQFPVEKTADFSLSAMALMQGQGAEQGRFLAAASGIAPDQAASAGETLIVLTKREVPQGTAAEADLSLCRILVQREKQQFAMMEFQEDVANHCQYRVPGRETK